MVGLVWVTEVGVEEGEFKLFEVMLPCVVRYL